MITNNELNTRKVTIIPMNPKYDLKMRTTIKRDKVAAYCRVSTDSAEQKTSYDIQVSYYTKFIKEHENWEFVGIYADEGITGTSTKNRKQFNKMIEDCRAGKIDQIYVKSISRFARNTVDCVSYIRELKGLGVNIHFENIGIDTLDSKGELLIAILASIAQEESQTISENIRWSVEKRFMEGKVIMNTANFLGYAKDDNGMLMVIPEEALIVRKIYEDYLDGYTANQISARLENDGILSPSGKKKWYKSTIMSILTNEKYKGDAVLQKTFQPDLFEKKRYKNEGQAKQYYVENSHPPIIAREAFDQVQAEIERRNNLVGSGDSAKGKYSSRYPFSKMITCSCGDTWRRHNHQYKGETIAYWICPTHQKDGNEKCAQKPIKEKVLEDTFIRAINKMLEDKDDFINTLTSNIMAVVEPISIAEYTKKKEQLNTLRMEMYHLNKTHSEDKKGSTERSRQALEIMAEIDTLTEELAQTEKLINTQNLVKYRREEIEKTLEELKILENFDSDIFTSLTESLQIDKDKNLLITLKCGLTLTEYIR
ncbi:MAG: recombinase family protein [Clostridia bacterium]